MWVFVRASLSQCWLLLPMLSIYLFVAVQYILVTCSAVKFTSMTKGMSREAVNESRLKEEQG